MTSFINMTKFFFFRASGLTPYVSCNSLPLKRAERADEEQAPERSKAYVQISGGGRNWPDIMGQPAQDDCPFFRKELVDTILECGLTGIEFCNAEIERSYARFLKKEDAPPYFWGRIFGRAEARVCLHGSKEEIHPDSNGLIQISKFAGLEPIEYSLKDNESKIPDFFYFLNINSTARCCSERFFNLAKEKKMEQRDLLQA